jgi:acetoin utilization deacetylase AcuC-like enzyme
MAKSFRLAPIYHDVGGLTLQRSLEEERPREDADHRERHPDFHGGSNREADPRGNAGPSRLFPVAVGRQLANDRSDKRPDDQPWQPQEQPEQGTERRACHGSLAGAEAPGTDGGRGEVDQITGARDDADDHQRRDADALEAVRPRGDDESGKDQQMTWQRRHDDPDHADDHEGDRKRPQQDGHTIPAVSLTLFTSDRFADHLTPPGHPERVARHDVMQVVASEFRDRGGHLVEPRAATEEELARIHDRDHVALIRSTAGRAVALDADTFTSPDTYDVACLAAGAAVSAVDHVVDGGPGTRAMALIRPPGHHAERSRAMGFCFFNNIAVAAAHARARGLSRVAIVDYDVHHGNGTQWSFYSDPAVLFISSHQYPYYPGSGAADEIGTGAGEGFTVNLPLAAGATDSDYERVYDAIAWPILGLYKPELILVSAGFDAYKDDPLAGMRVEADCFGRLTAALAAIANDCCGGRVVAVTEGGYDLKGLADSLRATVHALESANGGAASAPTATAPRGAAAIQAVTPHLAKYWPV